MSKVLVYDHANRLHPRDLEFCCLLAETAQVAIYRDRGGTLFEVPRSGQYGHALHPVQVLERLRLAGVPVPNELMSLLPSCLDGTATCTPETMTTTPPASVGCCTSPRVGLSGGPRTLEVPRNCSGQIPARLRGPMSRQMMEHRLANAETWSKSLPARGISRGGKRQMSNGSGPRPRTADVANKRSASSMKRSGCFAGRKTPSYRTGLIRKPSSPGSSLPLPQPARSTRSAASAAAGPRLMAGDLHALPQQLQAAGRGRSGFRLWVPPPRPWAPRKPPRT